MNESKLFSYSKASSLFDFTRPQAESWSVREGCIPCLSTDGDHLRAHV